MLEALTVILEKEFDDVKAAYWLGRAKAQITSEFQPFEDARIKLVHKYAQKDENGDLPEVAAGEPYEMADTEAFNTEYGEMANEEIMIKYNPISVDRLIGIKGITGDDIAKLGRLIEDEDEAEPKDEDEIGTAEVPEPLVIQPK